MKYLFAIIILYTCLPCRSQDIIILKNGDEIQSKILEVAPLDIKYKRYDNLEGPVYTLPRADIFMVKYENGTKDIFGRTEMADEAAPGMSSVYFLRKTGSVSSLIGYEIFIDEKSICKLNNNSYSIHDVPPGKHSFSVQFFGRKSKVKAEKLKIDLRPGKTYFIEVRQNSKIYEPDTYCVQISEAAGKELLLKLEEDPDCN